MKFHGKQQALMREGDVLVNTLTEIKHNRASNFGSSDVYLLEHYPANRVLAAFLPVDTIPSLP